MTFELCPIIDLNGLNVLNEPLKTGYSFAMADSTSSRRAAQISNDSFVYEFQPRISIFRGRGSSTEYSALIRPGRAVRSTTRSDMYTASSMLCVT